MLKIFTGSFHPDLEQALVEEVRQIKAADPLAPLALVAPSSPLVSRLRDLLVIEQKQTLLNVHFLTFHQLALRLYEELLCSSAIAIPDETGKGGVSARLGRAGEMCGEEPKRRRFELVPDLFFEHLLGQVAARNPPELAAMKLAELGSGAWPALWATLRDLKDAKVDPSTALHGVAEGLFDAEDAPKLQALFALYAAVVEAARSLHVGSPDDLVSIVTPWVPHSRFLGRLRRVCYYGFYDVTQVQLSLFEAVAAAAPTSLFFPLCDDPAFAFARRFFERYLSPLVPPSEQVIRLSSRGPRLHHAPYVQIMNAVGPDDELTLVCKEILNLVETHGYRPNEIGVVARSLDEYRYSLGRLFDQHRIPFTSTAATPAIQEPAVKVLLRLAWLPLSGFGRGPMLDVVTSQFYRSDTSDRPEIDPRPDLWALAVRLLGITRGEEEWRRLASAGDLETWAGEQEPNGEQINYIGIPRIQLRLLWNRVSRVIRDCQALPAQGRLAELTEAFIALARNHVTAPGLEREAAAEAQAEPGTLERSAHLDEAIRTVFAQFRQLDRVGAIITWEEWVRLFVKAMEQTVIPIESNNHPGVRVLDAMAARGLPFRALFLIGLNEKIFPRFIREDAFLRDVHRRILSETLGYKIDEKLNGYDEERLLFALLCQAAGSRLYLFYQRADAEGRSLAASSYLQELQWSGLGRQDEVSLPRRFSDRWQMPSFTPPFLTREELALSAVLTDHDPSVVLHAAGRDPDLFRNGWEALRRMESGTRELGPYDGLTGPLDRYWWQVMMRGLAPTPLEQYARCPFQYFAAQVLRLASIRAQAIQELPAQAIGDLCHAVLRTSSRRLVKMKWPQADLSSEQLAEQVTASAEEVFRAYEVRFGTGYALTWQLAKEMVAALAIAAIEEETREYRETGFRPVGFEVEAEGTFEASDSPSDGAFTLRGRLDRVDYRANPPGWRIVDYKYRQGNAMKSRDRDLLASAIRGMSLQPPLYALMRPVRSSDSDLARIPDHALPESVEFRFLAPAWERVVDRSRFEAAAWRTAAGRQLRQTIQTLLDRLRDGQFFMLPDTYCEFCDYSPACRRLHGPSWWRSHSAEAAKALRRLRKQKIAKGDA